MVAVLIPGFSSRIRAGERPPATGKCSAPSPVDFFFLVRLAPVGWASARDSAMELNLL